MGGLSALRPVHGRARSGNTVQAHGQGRGDERDGIQALQLRPAQACLDAGVATLATAILGEGRHTQHATRNRKAHGVRVVGSRQHDLPVALET